MSFPYNNPATDFRERTHMNNIINLLNLEDKNIEISKIERDDTAKSSISMFTPMFLNVSAPFMICVCTQGAPDNAQLTILCFRTAMN